MGVPSRRATAITSRRYRRCQPCCQMRWADAPRPVERGRVEEVQLLARSGASPGRPRSARPGPGSWRPGMGTAPLAMSQASATWLGVRSPWAAPMRRSRATIGVHLGHGVGRERAAAGRRVGRRVLAGQAPLPDRRVGQRHDAELAAGADEPDTQRHGPQEGELDLVAGQAEAALAQGGCPWSGSPWPSSSTRRRRARCPRRVRRPAPRPARRGSAARSARGSGRGR